MNLVGEIVITQSMLSERATVLPKREAAAFVDALFSLGRQTRELQDNVMAVRAQPVKVVFQRLPRLVRELERSLGKKAHLVLAGEDTEVDKTIVEELADPLIHMIRNSMDHGLETPEERIAAGKSPEGTIRVSAEHRGSRILICVSDDGRGINRERLVAKARSRGMIAEHHEPTPEEADNLIFHPGLSTAAAVTDVSGRGVGMDVVRSNVEALGGRITVESTPGRGCRFTLGLPLTLAVLDGMIVRAGTERFVFPLSNIVETMQLDPKTVETLPGNRQILQLRGEIAPLLKLRELLGIRAIGTEPNVVIVETESVPRLAIAVDEIVGQQQVVVKNLEASFRRVEGVSAATILGDGLVALILDVDALPGLSHPIRRQAIDRGPDRPQPPEPHHERLMTRSARHAAGGGSHQIVTFRIDDRSFGVDVGTVREIKGWQPATPLPNAAGHVLGVINLRGAIIAVYDLRHRLGLGPASISRSSVVIVVDLGERFAGILVDAVSDIVDVTPQDLRDAPDVAGEGDAVLNGLVVKGEAVVALLDLQAIVREAVSTIH